MGGVKRELSSVRNVCKLLKRCGKIVAIIEQFVTNALKIKLSLPVCKSDSRCTELCSRAKRLPKDWEVGDARTEALKLSKLCYEANAAHINISNSAMHKLCDLRLYDKLTTRLCPAKVYS